MMRSVPHKTMTMQRTWKLTSNMHLLTTSRGLPINDAISIRAT